MFPAAATGFGHGTAKVRINMQIGGNLLCPTSSEVRGMEIKIDSDREGGGSRRAAIRNVSVRKEDERTFCLIYAQHSIIFGYINRVKLRRISGVDKIGGKVKFHWAVNQIV